jgi:heme A synthase
MLILTVVALCLGIILLYLGFRLEKYFTIQQQTLLPSFILLILGVVSFILGEVTFFFTFLPDILVQKFVISKLIVAPILSFLIAFLLIIYTSQVFVRWGKRNKVARENIRNK